MKYIAMLLCLAVLLTACQATAAPTEPEESRQPSETLVTEPETQPATEETTLAPVDPLETLLQSMSLEEKVGQLFLARCPEANAAQDVAQYHLGGYILFGKDFTGQTPDSVRATIASYQEAAAIPLLIAVDEEGGTVTRVSRNKAFREANFPSPRYLYDTGGLELVLETEVKKCQLLSSLGINVNAAPVCDITTDPSAFMYSRSLGRDPETTGGFIAGMVSVMNEHHIGGILKHFPGYGNNTDTHVAMAVDARSLEALESVDLVPFAAGIEAGCGAIMVSHTIIECLDPQLPATLSPMVHAYLREEMCFSGVIVTDALDMQAITDHFGEGEAAVLAVLAGNDLLCTTNYQVQYEAVLQAVRDGRIPQEMLDDAVMRILHWKQNLGLLELEQ